LQHVGINIQGPTRLHMDNQAAIVMIGRTRFEKRLKHIDVRYHFIKQEVGKSIELTYVQSAWNLADLFTKSLPLRDHIRLRLGLRIIDLAKAKLIPDEKTSTKENTGEPDLELI